MRRRDFELNYWPSVADFMLALFILAIASGALMLVVQRLQTSSKLGGTILSETKIPIARKIELEAAEKERDALKAALQAAQKEREALKAALQAVEKERDTLKAALQAAGKERDTLNSQVNDLLATANRGKPPIVIIGGADLFNFKSGQAKIESTFREALQGTHFPELVQTVEDYPTVDTIEVIGHTDSSTFSKYGNLDLKLVPYLTGQISLNALIPGSNADLGLLRALAIRAEWNAWLQRSGRQLSRSINVRCYSAANSAPVDPRKLGINKDDLSRRIEIRFTQLKP